MRKIWFIVHALGWMSVVGLFAWLWFRDPLLTSTTADREDRTILRDRAYRMTASGAVKLDVYLPPNRPVQAGCSGLLPGVLAIHGGSWIGGSKSEYGPQLARLTRHGYVVFAADYQLARPGKPSWPGRSKTCARPSGGFAGMPISFLSTRTGWLSSAAARGHTWPSSWARFPPITSQVAFHRELRPS